MPFGGDVLRAARTRVVTVAGLAQDILMFTPDALRTSYERGLMRVRRLRAASLVPAALGLSGPLIGAAEQVWDDVSQQPSRKNNIFTAPR
jgi:hypothetical protein